MTQISIIIAARNESRNLRGLFAALTSLNYPKDDYEIIFVNDQSTDNTKSLIDEFCAGRENSCVFDSDGKIYAGKRGALDIGISHSKYNCIMITDADCEPEPNWLAAFAKKFEEGNDFAFGLAPFKQENNFVNKISCFENFRSQLLMTALAKMGMPYSATARSFGFSKSSFMKLDGYKNTTETLSGDDDLLLREAVKHNMKVGVVEESDALVFSSTKSKWKDYLKQKARHTSTSRYYLPKHKIVLGLWHLVNISFLLSPVLMIFSPYFILPLVFKLLTDVIITQKYRTKFLYKFSVFETLYLQIVYELLLIVNYFASSSFKKRWD